MRSTRKQVITTAAKLKGGTPAEKVKMSMNLPMDEDAAVA